jgi:hypothetical protein
MAGSDHAKPRTARSRAIIPASAPAEGREGFDAAVGHVAWFLGDLLKLMTRGGGARLVRKPATAMASLRARMEQNVAARVAEVGDAGVLNDFRQMARAMPDLPDRHRALVGGQVRALKRALRRDEMGRHLLALYQSCERVRPHGLAREVLRMDLASHFPLAMSVSADLREVPAGSGELAATALVRATRELLERAYVPYVVTLWHAADLLEGKAPSHQHPEPGSMAQQLVSRLGAQNALLDPRAIPLRNAFTHAHWAFLPSAGAIEYWQRRDSARSRISVAELRRFARVIKRLTLRTLRDFSMLAWCTFDLATDLSARVLELADDLFSNDEPAHSLAVQALDAHYARALSSEPVVAACSGGA